MAALSITASQVLPSTGPTDKGIFGQATTPGQSMYWDTAAGQWKLADANAGSAAAAGADGYGIALSATSAAGQPGVVARPGAVITLGAGAAPAAGTVYFVGETAGALDPAADVATSGDKVLPICLGVGSNKVMILTGAYNAGSVAP